MNFNVRENSLIAFTLLGQFAVGAFWVLLATDLLLVARHDIGHTVGIPLAPLLVLLVAMALSLGVALLHLGSPRIAYKAIANLRTSWLSREIATANLFIATAGGFFILHGFELGSDSVRSAAAWLTVLAGASFLYSMSRVYRLRTVPIWNTIYTPLSFLLAALILGSLGLGLVFSIAAPSWFPAQHAALNAEVLPIVTTTALVFLGCEFLLVPARMASLLSGSPQERQAIGRLFARHRNVFFARLATNLAGTALVIGMLVQSHFGGFAYFLAFAIILTSETLDRYLFYAAREASRL